MSLDLLRRYDVKLQHLAQKGRQRDLIRDTGSDFTSNDYLGLASSPRMCAAVINALDRGVPVGAGGSRLLRGNHAEHVALEEEAAAFFGCERMLYFGSGYAANLAALSTLPQRGDLIVHDALIHASAHDGIRAGRAEAVSVAHNDANAVEDAIVLWRKKGGVGTPWIVVESIYSMDGDRAPLSDLIEIADRNEGFLYVDEAHGTGVHGNGGRGCAADLERRDNVIVLHTCGKALGVAGALIGANRTICEFLINRARPFIYATAPSPLQAASVREALVILADEPERQQALSDLVAFANRQFSEHLGGHGSGTQILPVIIGENGRTMRLAEGMRRQGFDIRAIRPPTVPAGTARLRITITLNVDKATIADMVQRLAAMMARETS
ncbi:8-amino-7-oxononanoate synthase [Rhizobium lusitanum]|uniref:8-amino-7-oxononanoate synthase n=1 Tax=Rhizobium lusitanum TaxID=293958 RepID=A0A7X0MD37_9HYPH|nr:8-amino-7-oxononanoate synthase [Rhizobium lusitanum]MBB6486036.1 8-amino-7-oxononanoate synthase [Rhizobium lusitanum]